MSASQFTIVIAGGGTGGHLFPGMALAEHFEKHYQVRIVFIGTSYGIENKILPKTHYIFERIWMRGLQRKIDIGNLLFPLRLVVSLGQCAAIYSRYKPSIVVGTGGYVSGPALLAGLLLGVPTAIQEQNSYPGLVNRLIGKRVSQVHLTFQDSRAYFGSKDSVYVSGNPVRAGLGNVEKAAALERFQLSPEKATIFVFGGSQGARAINKTVTDTLPALKQLGNIQILWAAGKPDFNKISQETSHYDFVHVYEFIEDMASAYAAADVVLSRAGATALSEIALAGLPAILVPFPFAAAGHQERNARSVEKAGAAQVVPQQEFTATNLLDRLKGLFSDRDKLANMSKAAFALAKPNAAREIADKIMTLAIGKNRQSSTNSEV